MGTENEGTTGPTRSPGTSKGEEMIQDQGKEPGRHDASHPDEDHPSGTRTARDSTGVSPDAEDPIDPASPKMPPA